MEMCCLGRSKRLLPASAGHEFCHGLQRSSAESMVLGPYGSNSRQAEAIPIFCSVIRQDSGIWQHILPVPTPLLLPLPGCIRQGGVWGTSSKPELLRPDCINRHLEGVRGGRQGCLHLQEPERLLCTGDMKRRRGPQREGEILGIRAGGRLAGQLQVCAQSGCSPEALSWTHDKFACFPCLELTLCPAAASPPPLDSSPASRALGQRERGGRLD